jgi:simple sugar transport system ATP-binding protein
MITVNPTAGLDLAMSLRIRQELKQYAADGRSVLLISPDLDELLKTCDRISVMFAGRIIATENVSNLNSQTLGLLLGGSSLATTTNALPPSTDYNIDRPIEIGQDISA